ncbi:IS3 family transposase [uncultured Veillonella sp.]|uniref:IS3 family transposase n=1 Tax=uncultured Veillonella sp. TaxID=159268 RepID=UPI0028EC0129|nr:IS3 family transposase [uncultured Veillonella sp.]
MGKGRVVYRFAHHICRRCLPGQVTEYIRFFNEERPAYALGYLTPKQYRERFAPKRGRADT